MRERRGDLSLLAGYFVDQFNKKLGKTAEGLSSEAMGMIMDYHWPGNVRELENTIERAILLSTGPWITPEDLPSSLLKTRNSIEEINGSEVLSIKRATRRLQRDFMAKALKRTGGNKTQAAKLLEISRPMLIQKIKEYGL